MITLSQHTISQSPHITFQTHKSQISVENVQNTGDMHDFTIIAKSHIFSHKVENSWTITSHRSSHFHSPKNTTGRRVNSPFQSSHIFPQQLQFLQDPTNLKNSQFHCIKLHEYPMSMQFFFLKPRHIIKDFYLQQPFQNLKCSDCLTPRRNYYFLL